MEMACGTSGEQMALEGGMASSTEKIPSSPQNSGLILDGFKVQTKTAVVHNIKRDIPAKKDRLDPLKIDMSKHFLLPPTSAQLSLQCLECHIIFSDHKSKERHLKQSHPAEYEQCMLGDSLFACYVCDRHFTCSTELLAHQRTHTEKQPFKCPICGEAFSRSSELTIHKKVHFGLHGYTCSDCGKPCKTLTLLKYHRRTHTGERPYVCKDCGKRFSMSKALQKHVLTHTQEEMDGEEAVLRSPTREAPHINPLGLNPHCKPAITFSCTLCNGIFKTAKTRLQHMKHKHSESRDTAQKNTASKVDRKNEGQPVVAHTEICLPSQALQNLQTFTQGQSLQQIELLGHEGTQAFISMLGRDQVKDKEHIIDQEHVQVQRKTKENAEKMSPTELMVLTQGQSERLCLEQKEPESLVVELTQGQSNTLCLDQRLPEAIVVEQNPCHIETEKLKTQIEMFGPEHALGQSKAVEVEQTQLQVETLELDLTHAQMEKVVVEQTPECVDMIHLEHLTQPQLQVETMEVRQTNSSVETAELDLTEVQVELQLTEVQVDSAELDMTQIQIESTELDLTPVRIETQLNLAQVQVKTTELKLESVKTSESEQTEKQLETWEQVQTQTKNESTGEGLQNIDTEKCSEIGHEHEHTLQSSGMIPEDREQTSVQKQQLPPRLCLSFLQPEGSAESTSPRQEIEPQTPKLQCLSKQPKSKRMEKSHGCPLSKPILPHRVKEGQQSKLKNKTSARKSTTHSEILKRERECPGYLQKCKDLGQHCETQSKARRSKGQHSKEGCLVVQVTPSDKVKQSKKRKPLQTHKIHPKDDLDHKQEKMLVTPQLVQKVHLPQKAVREKKLKALVLPKGKIVHQQVQQIMQAKEKVGHVPLKKKKSRKCVVGQSQLEKKEKVPLETKTKKRQMAKMGQRSKMEEGMPPEKKQKRKQEKVQDNNINKVNQVMEDKEKIKQQSLLLLKGRKQPQLKVHKLDPNKTQEQPQQLLPCPTQGPIPLGKSGMPLVKKKQKLNKKSQQHKKKTDKKQPRPQVKSKQKKTEILVPPLLSSPIQVKPKANRKRKASLTATAETTLGSPHARLAFACADCGERFSEALPLEEHNAAVHTLRNMPSKCNLDSSVRGDILGAEGDISLGLNLKRLTKDKPKQVKEFSCLSELGTDKTPTVSDPGKSALLNGEVEVGLPGFGGELTTGLIQPPKSSVLGNSIHSDNLGMQATTDWDMEMEMGEIGLGDRVERVSFPALNASPSLPLATSGMEVDCKEGRGTFNGENSMESAACTTSDLCAREIEHANTMTSLQKNEGVNCNMKLSKDCTGDHSHDRVHGGVMITDSCAPLDTVSKTQASACVISLSSQVTSQNCDQSSDPTSTRQLQNVQLLEEWKEERLIIGGKFEEENKDEEEVSGLYPTTSVHKPKNVTGNDIKEELLFEVDIVTVGNQSVVDSTLSQNGAHGLESIPKVSHTVACCLDIEKTQLCQQKYEESHMLQDSCEFNASVRIPALPSDTQVNSSADCTEIKQEEEEVEVERREGGGENFERVSVERNWRRSGDQRSGESVGLDTTNESEAPTEGCQVIIQLQSLSSNSPIKDEEGAELFHNSRCTPFKVHLQPPEIGPKCQEGELLLGTGISDSCLPASLEESADEQIVFELESVTTSVEVLKTEEEMEVAGTEDQVARPGDSRSPSVLFERFFAGRQRDGVDTEQCQNDLQNYNSLVNRASVGFGLAMGPQNGASGMPQVRAVTGQVIKVEDFSLVPCQKSPCVETVMESGAIEQVLPYEQQGGVRVFLVKEENPLVSDKVQELPGFGRTRDGKGTEKVTAKGNICADSEALLLDGGEGQGHGDRGGTVNASPLALDVGVGGDEQCIVFQVKEEEREVAFAPPQKEHGFSVLLVSRAAELDQQDDQGHASTEGSVESDLHSGPFTDSSGIWVSVPSGCGVRKGIPENEEYERSREGLMQVDPSPDVFISTGEGEQNTEQQSTEELLEFLLQTSDSEDSDSPDSEPEGEAFAIACYGEIGCSSSTGSNKISSTKHTQSKFGIAGEERPGSSAAEENTGGAWKEGRTPIEYFLQYLGWETWEEIALCNPTLFETPTTMTSKEVSQFVGIHVAMGTLKFPDKKLYWQDFTKVPLIADAMPASRFFLLARKLRLARQPEDPATLVEPGWGEGSVRGEGETTCMEIAESRPCARSLNSEGAAAQGCILHMTKWSSKTGLVGQLSLPSNGPVGCAIEQTSNPRPADLSRTPLNPSPGSVGTKHDHITHSHTHETQSQGQEDGNKSHCTTNAHGKVQKPVKLGHGSKSTSGETDPLWQVRGLLDRVRAGCLALKREGNYGVDQHPLYLGHCQRMKSLKNPRLVLQCTVLVGGGGLVLDLNLSTDDSDRANTLQSIIPRNPESEEAMVFLCKEDLCTTAMLDRLLVNGVRSAGRVGGVRGEVADEFVSSDGEVTLVHCQQGFILSTMTERQVHQFSLAKDFEGVQKDAQLHRDLLRLYRTPLTTSSPARWPQSVLWHLTDLALVNSWLQYRQDYSHSHESLSLMAFRLEVAKALICTNGVSIPQSAPPHPPTPKLPIQNKASSSAPLSMLPLPDVGSQYDGVGHWPEQVAEGEEARCRFGSCERTSRVRCLKCCVFLCISRNHNCFLKFHNQGSI